MRNPKRFEIELQVQSAEDEHLNDHVLESIEVALDDIATDELAGAVTFFTDPENCHRNGNGKIVYTGYYGPNTVFECHPKVRDAILGALDGRVDGVMVINFDTVT